MKTVMHPLLIAVSALLILSISKAYAGGPGYPPDPSHRSFDGFSRTPDYLLPLFRDEDGNRDRVNNDRMYWNDRLRDPRNPQPNGGGNSVPLDGGISLLLAAGLGLGLKKAMRKNKPSHEEVTAIE